MDELVLLLTLAVGRLFQLAEIVLCAACCQGGVDVPLSEQFTANAGVNVGFFGKTEVGLRLGVGYNF
jgi:hypothetical protein